MTRRCSSEVARSKINDHIIFALWGKSAGRCQMCGKLLYTDGTYGVDGNYAQDAHIHAVSKDGPRHKSEMTKDEVNCIDNLMLLCPEHHKMIDSNPKDYGDGRLIDIKSRTEERIRCVTEIQDDLRTRIVSYICPVNNSAIYHDSRLFGQAIVRNGLFPGIETPVNLNLSTRPYEPTTEYYTNRASDLKYAYLQNLSAIHSEETKAIFALSQQPLLVLLGVLIGDQQHVRVFQCQRGPEKWILNTEMGAVYYIQTQSLKWENDDQVVLVIDLSAKIVDERVKMAIDREYPIYHITIENPNRDFVKHSSIQDAFIKCYRELVEKIKNRHPNCKKILLFPAMPVSLAVRLGMDYMPKTDIPYTIYDQATPEDGFIETITIPMEG